MRAQTRSQVRRCTAAVLVGFIVVCHLALKIQSWSPDPQDGDPLDGIFLAQVFITAGWVVVAPLIYGLVHWFTRPKIED